MRPPAVCRAGAYEVLLAMPGASDRASTLDLLGEGLTLFTVPGTEWERAVSASDIAVPLDVRLLDRFSARAIGVRGRSAHLVRPDGIRVGSWLDDDHAIESLETATVRARCRSGSKPMFASSAPGMQASPQHVA